jgi:hypothetical protein
LHGHRERSSADKGKIVPPAMVRPLQASSSGN